MSNETKSTPNQSTLEDRIRAFRDRMAPAMHLLPTDIVDKLNTDGFFKAPASTKYHGAYEGGLFDHSYNVASALIALTEMNGLSWERPESPYIIGMFHDLCKQDQYQQQYNRFTALPTLDEIGGASQFIDIESWDYNPDTLLKGHGEKSVMLLSRYLRLTMEEVLCIRYHMGAFVDQKEWGDYTRAIHLYPNVLWTHMADMIAAHIVEVDK